MKLHQISVHTENPRVLPTEGAIFRFESNVGDLNLHVLRQKYQRGWAPLVGIPASRSNCETLESEGLHLPDRFSEWILPPLQLMKESFGPGTCFLRIKEKSDNIFPDSFIDLIGWPAYSPYINSYVPASIINEAQGADISSGPDRSEWDLRVWQGGRINRPAKPDERDRQVVPATICSFALFDFFLARSLASIGSEDLPTRAIDTRI